MKKSGINWNLKKVTATILGVLGIGMLTSCYGMPTNPAAFDDDLWAKETSEANATSVNQKTTESEINQ